MAASLTPTVARVAGGGLVAGAMPAGPPDPLSITLVQVLRILREDARDFSVG